MNAQASTLKNKTRLEQHWPEPLTAKQWHNHYPGLLDNTVTLAATANVILQLALPGVGYGVAESRVKSGSIVHHPLKRSRTTFTYLAVAMMGTTEEKRAYRQAVNGSHRQVYSTAESPVEYNAFDPQLQLWVAACLYWGMVDVYQKVYRPLSREQQQRLYQLSRPLGTTLQVRENMWPADLQAFEQYWQDGLANLQIDDTIREYLMIIVDLKFLNPVIRLLFGRVNRFITTGFLPQALRDQMQLEWSDHKQRRFERVVRLSGRISRLFPRPIRQAAYLVPLLDFRRRLKKGKALV